MRPVTFSSSIGHDCVVSSKGAIRINDSSLSIRIVLLDNHERQLFVHTMICECSFRITSVALLPGAPIKVYL